MRLLTLVAWERVQFEILIYQPPGGIGNLRRLLRSISRADLSSVSPPHITIELPPNVDDSTQRLLAAFRWPPSNINIGTNLLSLRHRVPRQQLTEEQSSIRFIESFWPTEPSTNHVLVLSSNTELAPNFFHCKALQVPALSPVS